MSEPVLLLFPPVTAGEWPLSSQNESLQEQTLYQLSFLHLYLLEFLQSTFVSMQTCSGFPPLKQTTENWETQAPSTGSSRSAGMLARWDSRSRIPLISRSALQTLIRLADGSTSFSDLPHTAPEVVF